MKTKKRSLIAVLAAMTLLTLPGSASWLEPVPAPAMRALPPGAVRPPAARVSRSQCADLAVKLAVAKARVEMSDLLAGKPVEPATVAAAMASDRALARRVEDVFADSDIIRSQHTPRGDCVVTVQLPLDSLRRLAGPRPR